jgi:hypothetical protein
MSRVPPFVDRVAVASVSEELKTVIHSISTEDGQMTIEYLGGKAFAAILMQFLVYFIRMNWVP